MESIASGCGCEHCKIGPEGPAKNKIDFVLIKIGIGALAFIAGLILPKTGCSLFVFLGAYLILGHSVIIQAAKNIVKGKIFDENFLILIASAGAFAIGEYPEAAGVMLFYGTGEYLQDRAVGRSKKSIQSLLKIKPDSANLETEKGMIQVDPDTVSVGEIIVVKPGEHVPPGALVRADSVIFDKTGTLTTGSFSIADIVSMNGLSREELLYYAAHGEYYSRHPVAEALRNEYGKPLKSESIGRYTEISGFGVRAMVDNREIVIGNSRTIGTGNSGGPGNRPLSRAAAS